VVGADVVKLQQYDETKKKLTHSKNTFKLNRKKACKWASFQPPHAQPTSGIFNGSYSASASEMFENDAIPLRI
jgi:hypothetical protein